MKKCPKTLNGVHDFVDNSKEYNDPIRDIRGNYINYPICRFCGTIDNTKK